MADEGFLSRWSRRKAESQNNEAIPPAIAKEETGKPDPERAPAEARQVAATAAPQLTIEDVAKLTKDSDYSAFLARGVDENVKRSALKKLFADPHFNVMDGLDIYIDDYNKFEPIPAAVLASLNHAKSLLDPLSQLEKPVLPALDDKPESRPEPEEEPQQEEQSAEPELAAADTPDESEAANAAPAPDTEQQEDAAKASAVDPLKLSQARP